jgi:GNAT superfamily N-acetyltransferase
MSSEHEPEGSSRREPPPISVFAREHLESVVDLFGSAGWDEYTDDAERTYQALVAPGSTTLVVLDGATVVALVQVQSDGLIQAHVSCLLVADSWRRAGLGRLLLREAFTQAGGVNLDIRTRAESYYVRLGATQSAGFRLTRADLGL